MEEESDGLMFRSIDSLVNFKEKACFALARSSGYVEKMADTRQNRCGYMSVKELNGRLIIVMLEKERNMNKPTQLRTRHD